LTFGHAVVKSFLMSSTERPTDPASERTTFVGGLARRAVRWDPYIGPQLIVLGAILLDVSLPQKLTIGPTWLLPSVEALLLVGLTISLRIPGVSWSPTHRTVAIALIALVSVVNIVSLALLVHELLKGGNHNATGHRLILAGMVLWVTNVLLFGLWFWELDRGGPAVRRTQPGPPDFLFPQMNEPEQFAGWEPNLIDYLYVSFTNATAFSPTDAMPLSRIAKVLMAVQATTALVTIGLVVARAVNILS
jgi:hypothetical protein